MIIYIFSKTYCKCYRLLKLLSQFWHLSQVQVQTLKCNVIIKYSWIKQNVGNVYRIDGNLYHVSWFCALSYRSVEWISTNMCNCCLFRRWWWSYKTFLQIIIFEHSKIKKTTIKYTRFYENCCNIQSMYLYYINIYCNFSAFSLFNCFRNCAFIDKSCWVSVTKFHFTNYIYNTHYNFIYVKCEITFY